MSWVRQLEKHRGSRPRCVLLVEGDRREVAERLTRMVDLRDVVVSPCDIWMPYGKPVRKDSKWNIVPSLEAILNRPNGLVPPPIQRKLRDWWLAVPKRANAPNWDIASACTIRGEHGLLLVEAKAHINELSSAGKPRPTSPNGLQNHDRIGKAVHEAAEGLRNATGGRWNLSRDHHYQLSNRFAWSWKLATLGFPVVLVYLGFLNAQEMADEGPLLRTKTHWAGAVRAHGRGVVDEACWGKWMDIEGVPFITLIRGIDQSLDLDCE